MASYGRNFEFRVPPQHGQRKGRFYNAHTAAIVIGAPVTWDTEDPNTSDQVGVVPAASGTAPRKGLSGVLVYESDTGLAGFDAQLTTYSDIDTAPVGKAVQVVSGDHVKVVLKNTEDRTFLNVREYEGRVMVAGDLTTISVGDYLSPGTGNDTAGYWAVEATAADAWLVIENVNADRGEVEARFVF